MRKLGSVELIQIQRSPLKTKRIGYDPAPLLAVEEAALGPNGMLGHSNGGWVIDANSELHPSGRGGGNRALSIGFSSHYALMSRRYGNMPLGEAGENLIVDTPDVVTIEDLAGTVVIETAEGPIELVSAAVAAPCREFASYLLGLPDVADRSELSAEFEFLEDGMRGFVFGLANLEEWKTVRPGDGVWIG